jgi:glycosyltransferase involved in cell wall biosynthesis
MKVVQINVVYGKGSTGKIVKDIHNSLKNDGIESAVCYGRGGNVANAETAANSDNTCKTGEITKAGPELVMKAQSLWSRFSGYCYAGCALTTPNVIRFIKTEKPDVVHLHCLNGYFVNIYKLLNFLKQSKIATVLTLHAELMHTAGCDHAYDCTQWKKGCGKDGAKCPEFNKQRPPSFFFDRVAKEWLAMRNAFEGFDNITVCAVSDWLRDRAAESPFFRDKRLITVTNGVDTGVFKYTETGLVGGEKRVPLASVLHVTPDFNSELKGGKYVVMAAQRMPCVDFIVVGAKKPAADMPKNITFIPHTDSGEELAAYYSSADVTLLTSKRESFSMVCAESLCCGTPIVGFKAGAPETIAMKDYSEFVDQGDIDALEEALKRRLNNISWHKVSIMEAAALIYSNKIMYEKYRKIYTEAK